MHLCVWERAIETKPVIDMEKQRGKTDTRSGIKQYLLIVVYKIWCLTSLRLDP